MFVGGASRFFSRSGLGCWTPLSLRPKGCLLSSCGIWITSNVPSKSRKGRVLVCSVFVVAVVGSNTYDEVLTADEAYIKYRA